MSKPTAACLATNVARICNGLPTYNPLSRVTVISKILSNKTFISNQKTNDERSYFLTILPIHPAFSSEKKGQLEAETGKLDHKTHQLKAETHQLRHQLGHQLGHQLPDYLIKDLEKIGERPSKEKLREIIIKLCKWEALTAQQIMLILKRKDKRALVRKHLNPMVKEGSLRFLYPKTPEHPHQAYIST